MNEPKIHMLSLNKVQLTDKAVISYKLSVMLSVRDPTPPFFFYWKTISFERPHFSC